MSLEDAERRMESRVRAGEAVGSRLAKGLAQAPAVKAQRAPAAAARAGQFGEESGSGSDRVRRGGVSDGGSDSDSGEGDNKHKRRRGGGAGGGGGGGGGAGDEEGQREDWEHDQAMSDDEEAPGVGDQVEQPEEEAPPQPPRALQDEEDELGALDDAGRNVQRLLRAARRRDREEDGEEALFEDDDDETFEDEDFVDPDKDMRLKRLLKGEPEPAPRPGKPPPRPVAAVVAAAAPAAPAAAAAKRPRSPEGGTVGQPAAKAPRVMDAETLAQLAQIEADCGISLAELRESLSHRGLTTTELSKRFKKNLRTETSKAAFKLLLKLVTRLDESSKLWSMRY